MKNKIAKLNATLSSPIMKKLLFAINIIGTFVMIYALNRSYPIFADDMVYSLISDGSKRVENFSEILTFQYRHYFNWGGRSVVHVIAQSLLLLDKTWADILNSIAYIGFVLCIYLIANRGNKKINPSLFFIINMMIWFLQPALGETMLWKTGSANYLWGSLIIILFISSYTKYYYTHTTKDSYYSSLLMLLFGIITGWTNENTAIASIVLISSLLIFYKWKKIYIPKWSIFGLIGLITGCAIMVSAPGNYIRYNLEMEILNMATMTKFELYVSRFFNIIGTYYHIALPITFVYLFTIILFIYFGNDTKKKERLILSALFFASAIVGAFSMIGAPGFPDRAWFGILTLMIIATLIMYSGLNFSHPFIKLLNLLIIISSLSYFCVSYKKNITDLNSISKILKNREDLINSEKQRGITDIIFYDKIPETKTQTQFLDIHKDSTDGLHKAYLRYYNVKSVEIKEQSKIH